MDELHTDLRLFNDLVYYCLNGEQQSNYSKEINRIRLALADLEKTTNTLDEQFDNPIEQLDNVFSIRRNK